MNVNISAVQEAKLSGGMHTWLSSGYAVMATDVRNTQFGGVVLLWEGTGLFELKEAKAREPNIISFKITTGSDGYYVVGCYIPPSDVTGTTLASIDQAMSQMPKGCTRLIVSNLNVDLEYSQDDRDEGIANSMDGLDVMCFTRYFGQHCGRLIRGEWTWRQRGFYRKEIGPHNGWGRRRMGSQTCWLGKGIPIRVTSPRQPMWLNGRLQYLISGT